MLPDLICVSQGWTLDCLQNSGQDQFQDFGMMSRSQEAVSTSLVALWCGGKSTALEATRLARKLLHWGAVWPCRGY